MNHRKVFHDSIVELREQPGVTPSGLKVNAAKPEQGDEEMALSFSLAIPQQAHDELEAAVARGEVVPLKDLNTKYAVAETQVDPLVTWLKSQGYTIVHITQNLNN